VVIAALSPVCCPRPSPGWRHDRAHRRAPAPGGGGPGLCAGTIPQPGSARRCGSVTTGPAGKSQRLTARRASSPGQAWIAPGSVGNSASAAPGAPGQINHPHSKSSLPNPAP
jgi:hypothetical protein